MGQATTQNGRQNEWLQGAANEKRKQMEHSGQLSDGHSENHYRHLPTTPTTTDTFQKGPFAGLSDKISCIPGAGDGGNTGYPLQKSSTNRIFIAGVVTHANSPPPPRPVFSHRNV